MKKCAKRILSVILCITMLCCIVPLFATTASAATGYDRGYTGSMAGDGKIYAHGLDLSAWQEDTINFYDIKAAGYGYVILRCGTTKGKDTYFEKYYTQAKAAGLDVGTYYYSYAVTAAEALTDANNTLSWIAGKKFEYPVYFDFENSTQSGLAKSLCADICYTYMDKLKESGYLVGMYSMASWLKQSWIKDYGLYYKYEGWVAHYLYADYDGGYETYTPTYSTMFGMYQYTSSHSFTVNGRTYSVLDANVCYKDYPTIVKTYGFNGYESGKWESDSNGWRYSDGGSYVTGWQNIDGEDYYFDSNNYMHTGWLSYDGKWYYFNPSNGIMQRGWIYIDKNWYYTNSSGVMQTGWIQPVAGEAWYYLYENGAMATGWILDGETTYYLNPYSGAMLTGWQSIDGVWHEFSPWGVYYHNTSVDLGNTFVAKISSNMNSAKLVSLSNNNVVINSDNGGADQLWKFERQKDGSYKITNLSTAWCIDVQDGSNSRGANIQTWEDIGGNPQRWVLTDDAGDGNYTLRPLSGINQDNVMDVENADDSDGNNIVISIENGGSNQKFEIEKVEMGDADINGTVNVKDVTRIQKILAGSYESANTDMIADVNGNGKLDVRDATYVQMYISEVIDSFPIS